MTKQIDPLAATKRAAALEAEAAELRRQAAAYERAEARATEHYAAARSETVRELYELLEVRPRTGVDRNEKHRRAELVELVKATLTELDREVQKSKYLEDRTRKILLMVDDTWGTSEGTEVERADRTWAKLQELTGGRKEGATSAD